jgi:hypothetical protein
MGKSLSFRQKVKGNFTPPQTEILEEDNVVEDKQMFLLNLFIELPGYLRFLHSIQPYNL